MTISRQQNIWDPLLDSLCYYQSGNFTTIFDRCFERALDSLYINIDNKFYFNKLRSRYFNAARVLGFLEESSTSLANHWSLNPPSLLKTSDGYILVSAPHIINEFPELFKSFIDHNFHIYCENKDIRKFCGVTLKKVNTLSESLEQELTNQNIRIVGNIEKNILAKLPPIDLVHKTCLQPSKRMLPEYYDEAEKFIYDEIKWVSARSGDLYDSALLRNKSMFHGKYNYLIRHKVDGDLVFYNVIGNDWVYLLGASIHGESLGVYYDENHSKLYLPFGLWLPTLIDRLLVSNSMIPASLKGGKWSYENVPASIVHQIFNLYPCLA
jgi:hypothetical protein